MKIDRDTWIISDTHFGHANIVKYCNRPENHDDIMMSNWSASVNPEDVVLHLGDLVFAKRTDEEMMARIKALPGQKYLIRGNHDKKSDRWYADLGFKVLTRVPVEYEWNCADRIRMVYFTHRPLPSDLLHGAINIHGHIHNNGYNNEDRTKDYRNVSVEVMKYRPTKLQHILYSGRYQSITEAPINTTRPN
jgi:calcineurin-like phosphoesterase family protein